MVGRLDEATYALAAMGIGVLATWALVSLFSSLATRTHVIVARRFGAKDYTACGKVLNNSLIAGFSVGILVAALAVFFAHDISHYFSADPTVGRLHLL